MSILPCHRCMGIGGSRVGSGRVGGVQMYHCHPRVHPSFRTLKVSTWAFPWSLVGSGWLPQFQAVDIVMPSEGEVFLGKETIPRSPWQPSSQTLLATLGSWSSRCQNGWRGLLVVLGTRQGGWSKDTNRSCGNSWAERPESHPVSSSPPGSTPVSLAGFSPPDFLPLLSTILVHPVLQCFLNVRCIKLSPDMVNPVQSVGSVTTIASATWWSCRLTSCVCSRLL